MSRIDEVKLKTLLGVDEDADVCVYSDIAHNFVEGLLASDLSETSLEAVEMFLAAHFYTLTKERGALASETIDTVSERYHNVYSAGLSSTRFGQQAIVVDTTGKLARESAKSSSKIVKTAEFKIV